MSLTLTLVSMAPAFSKTSVAGKSVPALSGAFNPISITCLPPGAKLTAAPAGTSTASRGRMVITPFSSRDS